MNRNSDYFEYLKHSMGPEKAEEAIKQARAKCGGFTKKTYRGKPVRNSQDTNKED